MEFHTARVSVRRAARLREHCSSTLEGVPSVNGTCSALAEAAWLFLGGRGMRRPRQTSASEVDFDLLLLLLPSAVWPESSLKAFSSTARMDFFTFSLKSWPMKT